MKLLFFLCPQWICVRLSQCVRLVISLCVKIIYEYKKNILLIVEQISVVNKNNSVNNSNTYNVRQREQTVCAAISEFHVRLNIWLLLTV